MTGYHTYKTCIEACLKRAANCNHCGSSCTQEENLKMMAHCIQLDMECAVFCYALAQLMSLGSDKAADICRICADMCEQCGAECGKHETSIAKNVRMHASNAQKNAGKWQRDKFTVA